MCITFSVTTEVDIWFLIPFQLQFKKEVTKRRRLKLSIIGVIMLNGYVYSATAILRFMPRVFTE